MITDEHPFHTRSSTFQHQNTKDGNDSCLRSHCVDTAPNYATTCGPTRTAIPRYHRTIARRPSHESEPSFFHNEAIGCEREHINTSFSLARARSLTPPHPPALSNKHRRPPKMHQQALLFWPQHDTTTNKHTTQNTWTTLPALPLRSLLKKMQQSNNQHRQRALRDASGLSSATYAAKK